MKKIEEIMMNIRNTGLLKNMSEMFVFDNQHGSAMLAEINGYPFMIKITDSYYGSRYNASEYTIQFRMDIPGSKEQCMIDWESCERLEGYGFVSPDMMHWIMAIVNQAHLQTCNCNTKRTTINPKKYSGVGMVKCSMI